MTKLLLGAGFLFALAAAPAFAAGANTPRVDQRQENQQERIGQGVESGELTAREAGKLEAQQVHIQNAENRAKADGDVTKRERARLHYKEEKASRNIARKKHNERDTHPGN
jgi:hypothetical protein